MKSIWMHGIMIYIISYMYIICLVHNARTLHYYYTMYCKKTAFTMFHYHVMHNLLHIAYQHTSPSVMPLVTTILGGKFSLYFFERYMGVHYKKWWWTFPSSSFLSSHQNSKWLPQHWYGCMSTNILTSNLYRTNLLVSKSSLLWSRSPNKLFLICSPF
jgi:hypothetical protein